MKGETLDLILDLNDIQIGIKGKDSRKIKCIQEMHELGTELLKEMEGRSSRIDVLDEFADVVIMLLCVQNVYMFSEDEVDRMIERKVEKFKDRTMNDQVHTTYR